MYIVRNKISAFFTLFASFARFTWFACAISAVAAALLLPMPTALEAAGKLDSGAIEVSVKHPILPVVPGITQKIEITLGADPSFTQQDYAVEIAVESGYGVMLVSPAQAECLRLKPGEPLELQYRWSGAIPTDCPVTERISVSVPELCVEAEAEFSVGMDLRVKEIIVPEKLSSGTPTHVEVLFYDSLHPEANVTEMLGEFEIVPELRLELVSDEGGKPFSYAVDPVLAKFFERNEERPIELAYPSGEDDFFKPGILGRDFDGRHIWRSVDGRRPMVAPPSPGEYRIKAWIRANTGGAAVREYCSPSFEVDGERGIGHGLPYLVSATLEIIAGLDAEMAERANIEIRKSEPLEMSDAAATLGIYMHTIARPSPIQMLGRYTHALTASALPPKEVNEFMRAFLDGFGDYGVLIVTKSGVSGWSAEDIKRNPYTVAPKGRIFEDSRYLAVPFKLGEDFRIDLRGSGSGTTSLWKIIPQGVNFKSYPQGKWHKSIAVHTGVLTPPPPNKIY